MILWVKGLLTTIIPGLSPGIAKILGSHQGAGAPSVKRTASFPLKIGQLKKETIVVQHFIFRGYVGFREGIYVYEIYIYIYINFYDKRYIIRYI